MDSSVSGERRNVVSARVPSRSARAILRTVLAKHDTLQLKTDQKHLQILRVERMLTCNCEVKNLVTLSSVDLIGKYSQKCLNLHLFIILDCHIH